MIDISEGQETPQAIPQEISDIPAYRFLAFAAYIFCVLSLVDGLSPQFQMIIFGGHILVTGPIIRLVFLTIPILGSFVHPSIRNTRLPMLTWLICIAFLLVDTPHLILARGMTLKETLTSYSDYYLLLLMGPALLAFRGAISERFIIRFTAILLVVCAVIGFAQYFTGLPILPIESVDQKFEVNSSNFFDDIRAFSLFTSGLGFGLFCALGGALGIALIRAAPIKGIAFLVISTVACYSTLTRLCYLVFVCTCLYALVLTFGKSLSRGLWLPFLYFLLAIITIIFGNSVSGDSSNLQSAGSLIMRIEEWTYYSGLIARSSLIDKLFGLGTVLSKKNLVPIDNVPLALALHLGFVGLLLFELLMLQMWLYLRRQALETQQPFIIAAASLWATLLCAGMFNIVLISFGAVFAMVILCKKTPPTPMTQQFTNSIESNENAFT